MARADVLVPSPDNLRRGARALAAGELVAIPTETVYGLAGNAFDADALARIFEAKNRPRFDPLIVHLAVPASPDLWGRIEPSRVLVDSGCLDESRLGSALRRRIDRLGRAFWPGPLTLVLPKAARVPDLATAGLGTVAIRFPRHPVAQALIRECGFPLAAPSANRFGRVSPTRPEHVAEELGDRIRFILDGGPCEIGLESTVLDAENLACLRPGAVAREELERALGEPVSAGAGAVPSSPGLLPSHYAPATPVFAANPRFAGLADPNASPRGAGAAPPALALLGILADPPATLPHGFFPGARLLARARLGRDLREAARSLFAKLRDLDAVGADAIVYEPLPPELAADGLGHAIADRLKRASA